MKRIIIKRSSTLILLFFFNSLFIAPQISVAQELNRDGMPNRIALHWLPTSENTVTVTSPLSSGESQECVEAGLELEHRFLVKICKRLNQFGTDCKGEKRIINTFSYDPIQENYRVSKDRLGDTLDPKLRTFVKFQPALYETATIRSLQLQYISNELRLPLREDSQWSLAIRAITTCKGDIPRFLADVSYFFTFGLVDLYGSDSGWKYFDLKDR